MRIFVNYRTGDGESTALAVARYLSERIGEDNVFYDTRSISPGALFDHELLRNVWRSDIMVAIIGPRWLDAGDADGRAIDKPEDWIRREIAEALSHQVRVVPFLIGDAPLPGVADLPSALADLTRCQYVKLDFRSPDAGLQRLGDVLDLPARARGDRPRSGRGQRGGIGSITATTVTAVTDTRGPVHIGDRTETARGGRADQDDT
jgi:hypothetical protein